MSADDGLLELIEENIHNLVEVQKKANKHYNDLSMEDYTEKYKELAIALYDEQTLLKAITHNLNAYFEIDTIWWFRRFRIIEGEWFLHRYIIKTPSNLRRQEPTWKYTLLKKLLIRLHKKYFLNDGGVDYAFSSVESHMWELPNFVEDNPVVRSIRKDIKKNKNMMGVVN